MDLDASGPLPACVDPVGYRPRNWWRRAFLALVVVQLILGLGSLAQNLGEVPGYGDTSEYLLFAQTLEVDPYRGFVYPALLALLDRDGSMGQAWREMREATRSAPGSERLPWSFLVLQLVQLTVFAADLAYFLRVLARATWVRTASRRDSAIGVVVVLFLLLLSDPLLAHFQLSVLTDGVALSASLVACAALVDFASSRAIRPLAGLALILSVVLAAGSRVEKTWVLAGTALGTLLFWKLLQHRWRRTEGEPLLPHAFLAVGIALFGVAASLVLQRSLQGDGRRWPIRDTVLDQRIVFPNLAAAYDALPEDVRARLSRAKARRHDEHIRWAHRVMDEIAKGDDEVRRTVIEAAAAAVLRERWQRIALDVVRDAAENVAATLSFYGRLAVLVFSREELPSRASDSDGATWTYTRMTELHPKTTRLYFLSSAVFFLISSLMAVAHFRGRRSGRGGAVGRRALLAWTPVGAFVLFNAVAFALAADLVHVRYAIFAHAALLALVYGGALAYLDSRSIAPGRPAQVDSAAAA